MLIKVVKCMSTRTSSFNHPESEIRLRNYLSADVAQSSVHRGPAPPRGTRDVFRQQLHICYVSLMQHLVDAHSIGIEDHSRRMMST